MKKIAAAILVVITLALVLVPSLAAGSTAYADVDNQDSYLQYGEVDGSAPAEYFYIELSEQSFQRLSSYNVFFDPITLKEAITRFIVAYESQYYNYNSRNVTIEEEHSANDSFYSLWVAIEFNSVQEYYNYYGISEADVAAAEEQQKPTSEGFFADVYEYKSSSFFNNEPAYVNSPTAPKSYAVNPRSFNAMFHAFMFGMGTWRGVSIELPNLYSFLTDHYPSMLPADIFSDFIIVQTYDTGTAFCKTNSDFKEGLQGYYTHFWEMSFDQSSANVNRTLIITYYSLNVINMYIFAVLAVICFVGICLVIVWAKDRKKKSIELSE